MATEGPRAGPGPLGPLGPRAHGPGPGPRARCVPFSLPQRALGPDPGPWALKLDKNGVSWIHHFYLAHYLDKNGLARIPILGYVII